MTALSYLARQTPRGLQQWWTFEVCGHQCDGQGPMASGLSWTEVVLAIRFQMEGYSPVRRTNAEGDSYVLWVDDFDDVGRLDVTMNDQSQTASLVVTQVLGLIPQTLLPDPSWGVVRSMYMQGETFQRAGLKVRPFFPSQKWVY